MTIPADRRHWLNENGEPLVASPTMVIPSAGSGLTPPPLSRTLPDPPADADNDVLGAIAHGEIAPPSLDMSAVETPPPSEAPPAPAPAFSRSLPTPEPDDGRVELYPPSTESAKPYPPPRRPEPTPPPRKPFPTPPPAWAGANAPRPRKLVPVAPSAPPDEPLRLKTSADIAVDLTSALASRMKPPPAPPRDLKPSTAVWILTTGLAITLSLASLFSNGNFAQFIVAIGAAQALAGYAWVTTLAFRRDVRRGLACAVPPITFHYLTNWKYARYRPLRFVISGGLILGLGLLIPRVQAQTRSWAGVGPEQAIDVPPPVESLPKLEQLRHYRDQRKYDALIALLRTLARTDSTYSEDAKNRVELSTELRALCKHTDNGVRPEALAAYTTWGGWDARELSLEASRSSSQDERLMALRLLPRWKDEDVARRIAEMIGRANQESNAAQQALVTLGGGVAERAAIPLLRRDDQTVRLAGIDILGDERVGGKEAVVALREVARTTPDLGTKQSALAKADQIEARLKR